MLSQELLLPPEFPIMSEAHSFPLMLSKQLNLRDPGEQYSWLSVLAPLPHNPASSHFHFSFHEAMSFPVGVAEITLPFPIVKPINSFMINTLPAPKNKIEMTSDQDLRRKKVRVNSPNCNNFHLLNILSQMNHFICCSHFLLSLIR